MVIVTMTVQKNYMLMRKTSDYICNHFELFVIENLKCGIAKHYGEWKTVADQHGMVLLR